MADLETLEKVIAEGGLVIGVFSIAKIQDNQNFDAFTKTFNLQSRKDLLLNPENRDKSIIVLRKGTEQIEIITSNLQCIRRANEQLKYQNEPVGIHVTVRCIALGGSFPSNQIVHVDKLIPQLNSFFGERLGWYFKQIEKNKFEVSKKLDSINEETVKEELERLKHLLNYLSITLKFGIQIESYAVSKIPRFGPYHGIWGPQEFMPSLTVEDVKGFEKFLSASPKIHKIAEGLNQTYTLTSINNRLALLWAITEAIFADKPKPMLSDSEIEAIMKCAKNILNEPERLKKLENALRDPNRLPFKSRNRRISDKITKLLRLNAEEVFQKIKTASKNRAKYLHEFKDDKEIRQSESYLRNILETYLKTIIEGDSQSSF